MVSLEGSSVLWERVVVDEGDAAVSAPEADLYRSRVERIILERCILSSSARQQV